MVKSSPRPDSQGSQRRRIAQIVEKTPIIAGSIVAMVHTCGKKGCRCADGEKHVSPYLAVRRKKKRVMISIPRSEEVEVLHATRAYKDIIAAIDAISADTVNRLVARKKRGR